jgi:NADH-quinone oxidoreductase subunit G
MCSRCVRFTREVSGTAELQVVNRGDHSEIDIFPGQPCNNKLAGNVVDLCPVGALCSKDFLYKQRVWFLRPTKTVCPNCSTGCSVHVDQNKNIVYRLRPRFNPQAQGHFMCDEGRFGYKYVNDDDRLLAPAAAVGGRPTHVTWEELLPALQRELAAAVAARPEAAVMVLSPWLTCEEAFLAAKYWKGLSAAARLALGPVRVVGEDDRYPKGPHGEPPPEGREKFTIRAEKCPNRRGVEAVLRHFQGEVVPFDAVVRDAAAGAWRTAYLVGGDREPWVTPEQAQALARAELLVVQDILPSPASAAAKYVLPAGTFAEKDGTFVNHAGLAQAVRRAVASPGLARADGRIFMDLLGRRGLVHAPTLRQELAAEVADFAPLAAADPGEFGVMLG